MNNYEDYILKGAGYIPYLKETINPIDNIVQKHNPAKYDEESCRLIEEQGYISQLNQLV